MKKLIKLLAVSILALGVCLLVITGCGKASAPKANGEVTMAELNQAVGVMASSPGFAPRTIDDLTNFPAFKGRPFPVPPAGKKFAVDLPTRRVVIVDR